MLTQMSERLWAETTKTVGWIAECLAMGTRGYLTRTDPFFRLSSVGSADFLGRFQ